jgi:hypothetical protein
MKPKLLFVPAAIAVALLLAFTLHIENTPAPPRSSDSKEYRNINIIRCSPDWNKLNDWIEGVDIKGWRGFFERHEK